MSAILQLAAVPILTSAWGVSQYGVWLMLTTIPTYFALTDLGFIQAATADMTMHHARNEKESVVRVFQSTAVLISLLIPLSALAAVSLLLANAFDFPFASWISGNIATLALLIIYSAVALFSRITLSGFRSTGHYAHGTLAYDGSSFVEGVIVLAVAWSGANFFVCIAVQFAGRCISMTILYILMRRFEPWLKLGVRHASRAEIKRLVGPALSAMSVPATLALNLQGMVLVVGSVLSPAAAGAFVAVRTLTRIFVQGVGIFNRASMPEIAAAYAKGNLRLLRRLAVVNAVIAGAVLVLGWLFLVTFGPWLMHLWTGGKITVDRSFLALMALGMVVHGVWFFTFSFLLSLNRHGALGLPLFLASLVTVLAAIVGGTYAGLNGVAASAVAGDVLSLFCVLYTLRRRQSLGSSEPSSSLMSDMSAEQL
ncbi:lipopolysaccharide biosynthesis protein [Sphingomonas crusticola]|uniref:lipopolysaccharide biosynthesis protein n=1 Tax=Sphingomonas crusticola TaxID=1697973 RepID=UPI000E2658CD|nr:lipopolysaccharide biosynthesis protein [Sphingomonas crusticola]